MIEPFARVAVLGLGLIGGSLIRTLSGHGLSTVGFDPDEATADAARADHFTVAGTAAEAVADADLVVLAMPLPGVSPTLRAVAGALRADAVITDVGTLKSPVLAAVATDAPDATFVGGHPLAGIEQTGWRASQAGLFTGCTWALVLADDTDLTAWLRLAALLCDLGVRPVPTTAVEQDAAVARVIGLPHVLAEALALTGLAGGPLGLTLAAGSYLSGSRVARTRPELVSTWCDGNAGLPGVLDDAIAYLTEARDALRADGSILPLATAGHAARMNWEHRSTEVVDVPARPADLLAHGRRGGWLTAVTSDGESADRAVRLRGALPVD